MTATVTRIHPEAEVPDGYLTAVEFVEQAGIAWRQANFWGRTGYLHTAVINGVRYYPPTEAPVAAYTKRLLDAGIQLDTALDSARQLAAGHPVTLADGLITIKEQT